jgi:glycosyltransferase involved in cell wall biosynthesis
MLEQITPLILTFNEAPNIARTVDQLTWARQIVVVDSFSNDETLEILARYSQVAVLQRDFVSFADQCNYALDHANITTEWVVNLDADYVLTDELVNELRSLSPAEDVAGYRARFIYCVKGKRLRSGIYPRVTVLFRKHNARFVSDGHAHRVSVDGVVSDLKSPILHDDRKPLRRWLESQAQYAELEAQKLRDHDDLTWTDRLRRLLVLAPPAMLLYCLLWRGGVLDGWAGFYYAFQRTLAELILSLHLLESRDAHILSQNSPLAVGEASAKLKVQRTKV